jgi:hypothetical protein
MNEQRKFLQRANLHPPWAEDGIGLGASQCDFAVGCVGFGANGWDLDESDLHPGSDVLQRHRCNTKHDDERWNGQLGVERRFWWWRWQFGRRRKRPVVDPQRPMRRWFSRGCLGWLQLSERGRPKSSPMTADALAPLPSRAARSSRFHRTRRSETCPQTVLAVRYIQFDTMPVVGMSRGKPGPARSIGLAYPLGTISIKSGTGTYLPTTWRITVANTSACTPARLSSGDGLSSNISASRFTARAGPEAEVASHFLWPFPEASRCR